jgi:hypothetical protein
MSTTRVTENHPPSVDDTQHEGWAVAWLTVGLGCMGYLGAFIGVFLVLRSTRWSPRWKVAALAFPAVLVVWVKTSPQDLPTWVMTSLLFLTVGLVVRAVFVLRSAASRGSGQRHMSRAGAFVIAAVVVGIAPDLVGRLHSIGSYDLHDDVVAAARSADAADEAYGVISEDSDWIDGDGPSSAQAERLAGKGNARFVAIFDELEAKDGGFESSELSPEELGTCYVFPVVTSRDEGVESVTALSRFCFGPSEAGSYVLLSDR